MAEIKRNVRIFLKNGTEANWEKITDFIPGKGEAIIYNVDANHSMPRIKIGDGIHLPKDLPFISAGLPEDFDVNNITAKRVEHKLIFGADGAYQYDGSADVTVPVYTGEYSSN